MWLCDWDTSRFVLQAFDCSAKTLTNVPEVFGMAQKLVIYPIWPLFEVSAQTSQSRCTWAS